MTESEYLACADPGRLLEWLQGNHPLLPPCPAPPPSDRKLRLFACACARLGLRHEVYRDRAEAVLRSTEAASAAIDGGPRHTILDRDPALAARTEMEIVLALHSGLGASLAALLRDIIGNPFRPVAVRPRVGWIDPPAGGSYLQPAVLTPAVVGIARRAYDLRDWGALPVLRDALMDAGCEDEQVLAHLAEPLHVLGCWCVDLILGKE
jgi:hypothetical protein